MKRTGENVFSFIGVILFGVLSIGAFMIYGTIDGNAGTKDLVQEFINDENIKDVTAAQIITFLQNFFLYLGIVSMLCTVGGILSIIRIKRNGSAGKVLITTAILGGVLTLFVGLFGSIAYLIAGITNVSKNKKLARQN
ncbi:DUF4064 domain-containing protein [Exiguobacterium sp. s191]|uniref:DUF4064 domain-containing protein n=1 Tax=Exiguobacterium sp. s191 TaxID=2751196 RepID=UPI001BE59D6E|nr:DUF4064 domain-containing protein [Exiguobacterium sp. s191]